METSGRDPMARIEARLERIERMLEPLAMAAGNAPQAIAVLGDVVDEWAREDGMADERLRRLVGLVERVTRPGMLERLEHLVARLEEAPGVLGMLGDIVDDFARYARAEGVELDDLLRSLPQVVLGAARTAPAVASMLDAGPGALDTLGRMAAAVGEARARDVKPVGLFGALGADRKSVV